MTRCTCSFRVPTHEEQHLQVFYVRVFDEKCPQHAPIESPELWAWAQKAWADSQTDEEREGIKEFDWVQGFVWGTSEAIKKLEDFGFGTAEIRNALGLVKE